MKNLRALPTIFSLSRLLQLNFATHLLGREVIRFIQELLERTTFALDKSIFELNTSYSIDFQNYKKIAQNGYTKSIKSGYTQCVYFGVANNLNKHQSLKQR